MTPPHTPESLLALTKSPEGLEQMQEAAALYDGFTELERYKPASGCLTGMKNGAKELVPFYPTSLDAIFAAEERFGLHDEAAFYDLCKVWASFADALIYRVYDVVAPHYFAFLPPPLRLIVYTLTAQWKEQNQ